MMTMMLLLVHCQHVEEKPWNPFQAVRAADMQNEESFSDQRYGPYPPQ
jgi:hypothetical protein